MDQIIFVILLILGVPLCVGIWLIARAISARDKIEELNRRVDDLQLELARLKRTQPTPPKTVEEQVASFSAAPLPPRKEEIKPAVPPPISAPLPAYKPHFEPVKKPEPVVSKAPVIPPATPLPPPPVIPPLVIPELVEAAAPKNPEPESVFENAQASAEPETGAPRPDFAPQPGKGSFEMRLGTFWLVRIGIVMLLAGFAFFAVYAYHNVIAKLGPGGKVSLLYLGSGLLLGAGAWWQRRNVKESLNNYAQVVFAGGLAAVYFTTYAAHYIPPLSIIPNPLVDGTLLLAWAGLIAWIADRRKSEVMALFAICLAFFTSIITRVGEFTLYSNLLLTVTAVVFLVRNRWAGISFFSLITSYAGYAVWRFLHEDGWHWATPGEGLGLGACFLASYWIVFTAATFLSKSTNLSGLRRATFLTLNNGAFFALFLLTMLQVHTGGFWKFSLIYGSTLVGLALLAAKLLPSEPLTKNSYLTHGLVLVTLGFISKFSGLQLALILGMESVVLYMLGTQRQSAVLKFFGYAAALMATGWCAAGLKPLDHQGAWTGAGLGAMLAFNAFWSHRLETKKGPESARVESSTFTLLAFACWALATWFNTTAPHLQLALVLGVESAVFYNLVGGCKVPLPKFIAYGTALGAVSWCVQGLGHFDPLGLWMAVIVGGIMLLNTFRAHRTDAESTEPLRIEPTAFTALAFASWLAATWFNTTGEHLPLALAAEAVILTFSIYALRIREVTFLGQAFLILAQLAWLSLYFTATPPWWNPLILIAVTIGLSHWWQHQKVLSVSRNIFMAGTGVFALAAVAVAFVWLHPLVSAPVWLMLTSLLAVAVTAYGLVTRAWPLAICGQIFLGVSVWEFLQQLVYDKPEWYFPLVPIGVLVGLSLATLAWFERQTESKPAVRGALLQVAMAYRWLALGMSLLWIWDYVPERERVWAFMLAGVAVFALALWRNLREALLAAAIYGGASLALMWARENLDMDIYWPNLLALLAVFAMQQALRRVSARLPLGENEHGVMIFLAGLSLWRFISCWTSDVSSGFSMTMTWAGFAVVLFTAGMFLRERFIRWFGLAVLATSVGRVVLVDVWNEKTIYRVLTFMALGAALLVVGFFYNKYQEKIRQWL